MKTIEPACSTMLSGAIRNVDANSQPNAPRTSCVWTIPFGQPGGAARVHDVEHVVATDAGVGRLVLRGIGDQRLVRPEPGAVVALADQHEPIGRHLRQTAADPVERRGEGGAGDHHGGVGVVDQRREAGVLQHRTGRDDHDPGLARRPERGHQLEAVREHRGELVALLQTGGQQAVRQPIDVPVELAEGHPPVTHDQRGVVAPIPSVARKQRSDVHDYLIPQRTPAIHRAWQLLEELAIPGTHTRSDGDRIAEPEESFLVAVVERPGRQTAPVGIAGGREAHPGGAHGVGELLVGRLVRHPRLDGQVVPPYESSAAWKAPSSSPPGALPSG